MCRLRFSRPCTSHGIVGSNQVRHVMPIEAKPLFRPGVLRKQLAYFNLPETVKSLDGELRKWAELIESKFHASPSSFSSRSRKRLRTLKTDRSDTWHSPAISFTSVSSNVCSMMDFSVGE